MIHFTLLWYILNTTILYHKVHEHETCNYKQNKNKTNTKNFRRNSQMKEYKTANTKLKMYTNKTKQKYNICMFDIKTMITLRHNRIMIKIRSVNRKN